VKLTAHLQLVSRSRKCGSIHPLLHTLSWRSALLVKDRNDFYVVRLWARLAAVTRLSDVHHCVQTGSVPASRWFLAFLTLQL
jgi:hypothetical protein